MLGVVTTRNLFCENAVTYTPALTNGANLLDFIDSNTSVLTGGTDQKFSITVSASLANIALVIDCIGGDDNCYVQIVSSSTDTFNHVQLQNGANLILINSARTLGVGATDIHIKPSRDLTLRHLWFGFVYEFSREPEAPFDPEALALEFNDFRSRNDHLQMRDMRRVQKSLAMNFTNLRNTQLISDLRTSFKNGYPFYFFFRPIVATPGATSDITPLGFNGYLCRWADKGLAIPFILGTHVSLQINAMANYYPLIFGDIVTAPTAQATGFATAYLGSDLTRISWTHATGNRDGYVVFMGGTNPMTAVPVDNSFYDEPSQRFNISSSGYYGYATLFNGGADQVRYIGTGNSFVTYLVHGGSTTYYRIYSYNRIKNKIKYYTTSPLAGSFAP